MNNSLRTQQRTSLWTNLSFQQYATGILSFAIFIIGTVQWQRQATDPKEVLFFDGNMESALAVAESTDKLCLLYFGLEYCYPCDQFIQSSFDDLELSSVILSDYIAVDLSTEGKQQEREQLVQTYGIEQFPALVVTDFDGEELQRFTELQELGTLGDELAALNKLRVAPSSKNFKNKISDLQGPSIFSRSSLKLSEESEGKLGLLVETNTDYQAILHQAELLQHAWNKDIWIQSTEEGVYELILGAFDSRKEAKTASTYLQEWNHDRAEIIVISPESFASVR